MASRSLAYHPEARAEVDAAFDYYRERSVSIAQAFYDELEAAQFAIGTNPDTWAAYSFVRTAIYSSGFLS